MRHYSKVVSTLALFVALGGTSYAVTSLPKDSVGSTQIRAHAVTAGKLAPGLRASGPAGNPGSVGAQGVGGVAGATGATGPAGTSGGVPGPIGPLGSTGAAGPVGAGGAPGAPGPAGAAGAAGMTGPIGPVGANGQAGSTGPVGPAGSQGLEGSVGPKGDPGQGVRAMGYVNSDGITDSTSLTAVTVVASTDIRGFNGFHYCVEIAASALPVAGVVMVTPEASANQAFANASGPGSCQIDPAHPNSRGMWVEIMQLNPTLQFVGARHGFSIVVA